MYQITDQQIDFILNDITKHGIKTESLQHNLLDHICIIIEENLGEDGHFEEFYSSTIKTFYKKELREIEEQAVFLMNYKNCLVLNRNIFFLVLFTIFIGPFIAYDINWLATSNHAAGLYLPVRVWGSTLVYSLFPLLTLLVLFFTPEKFDPLIPKKSRVLVGINPFIKIIPVA
jgi:hypothetical protein